MQQFQGFTDESFGFFLMLRMNNNKAFFDANRHTYETCLKQPLYSLAQDLADTVLAIDPNIEARPQKCVARIYRSTRFSHNKLPYRDYLWIGWRDRSRDIQDSHAFGFYFDLSFDGMNVGAGTFMSTTAQRKAFRDRIAANPAGFERIAQGVTAAGFAICGEDYRRIAVPQALPPLSRQCFIKKSFYLQKALPTDDAGIGPNLVQVLKDSIRAMAPVYHFINDEPNL